MAGVVVTLQYEDLVAGKDLTAEILEAYGPGGVGLLCVSGVPGVDDARQALLPKARELALLDESILAKYEHPEAYYAVGWSRGREKFKGKPDVSKGSFYANPIMDDPSEGNADFLARYPFTRPNVWPEEVPDFEGSMKRACQIIVDVAKPIVQQIDKLVAATWPKNGTRLHDKTFVESRNVVSRLLHYYSVTDGATDGNWCGWHNDNSTITGLLPAMWLDEQTGEPASPQPGAGLVVEGRDGDQIALKPSPNTLVYQIGEAAQVLSGGAVHATPHMVRGHVCQPGGPKICRETLACFIQPHWDGELGPPEGASFDDIFKGRAESVLIPPLRQRLQKVPLTFGQLMNQSIPVYYSWNNDELTDKAVA